MNHYDLIQIDALNDFLDFGVTYPFVSLRRSGFLPGLEPTRIYNFEGLAKRVMVTDERKARRLILNSLFEAVGEAVDNNQIQSFAMSGGLDSRLILALLYTNHRQTLEHLPIYTRIHPTLTPKSDRDGIIVSLLKDQFALNVSFEKPDFEPMAYLRPLHKRQSPCLTGLWGGELLGGQIFHASPFKIYNIYQAKRPTQLLGLLKRRLEENSKSKQHHLSLYFELISCAGASATYENLTWLYPTIGTRWATCLFTNKVFLDVLFSIDSDLFKDYRIYVDLMKTEFPKFLEVPINNPALRKSGIPVAEMGVEPKSLSSPNTYPELRNLDEFQKQVMQYLENHPCKRYSEFTKCMITLL